MNIIDEWKEKQKKKRYRDGFKWAMAKFYLDNGSCQYLHCMTSFSDSPFDEGARKALDIISNYGACDIEEGDW